METQEPNRGRPIDHLQLVVTDLAASRRFYEAALGVLDIPVAGEGHGFFRADELVVSTADSEAAQGSLTGRALLAFQAKDRAAVEAFHKADLTAGGRDNGAPREHSADSVSIRFKACRAPCALWLVSDGCDANRRQSIGCPSNPSLPSRS